MKMMQFLLLVVNAVSLVSDVIVWVCFVRVSVLFEPVLQGAGLKPILARVACRQKNVNEGPWWALGSSAGCNSEMRTVPALVVGRSSLLNACLLQLGGAIL